MVALLSGFLSVVGVFSLAKLNVAKRVKEITIRKVLGASVREILVVINRSFTIVFIIALVVGTSLGFLISNAVLDMIYKFHVSVSIPISILTGVGIVLASLTLLSAVALGPANSNPVGGLRED